MSEKKILQRVERDKREGKAPSTQAGEFVREEIKHLHDSKRRARSPKQAVAIGLSKARRAGVNLPTPKEAKSNAASRKKATSNRRHP